MSEKSEKGCDYYRLAYFYYEALAAKKSSLVVFDVLKGMTDILKEYSKTDYADFIGYLYAASTYSIRKAYSTPKDKDLYYDALKFYLSHIKLDVEIDDKGKVVNHIEAKEDPTLSCYRELNHGASLPKEGDLADSKFIEVRENSTTILIQNLNIYLSADVVQQLNMNPKEVINNNMDEIKKAAIAAVRQALQNGGLEKFENNDESPIE